MLAFAQYIPSARADDPITVTEVNLTYDPAVFTPDTSWTFEEFGYAVDKLIAYDADGLYKGYLSIFSKPYTEWVALSPYQTDQLQADVEYAFGKRFGTKEGYTLPADILENTNNLRLITEYPGFTVKVNGAVRDDAYIKYNEQYSEFYVLIPLGKPSDNAVTPYLDSFTIDKTEVTLERGDSWKFAAKMTGMALGKIGVNWTVSGNGSSNTKIDADGNLTVGSDETSSTFTVTA